MRADAAAKQVQTMPLYECQYRNCGKTFEMLRRIKVSGRSWGVERRRLRIVGPAARVGLPSLRCSEPRTRQERTDSGLNRETAQDKLFKDMEVYVRL